VGFHVRLQKVVASNSTDETSNLIMRTVAANGPKLRRLWIDGVAFPILCLIGGLIAALAAVSNSPIVIGLVAGAILGVLLLYRTEIAVWFILIGGLILNGAIALYFPGLVKATWLFSMLGFFLLGATVLYLLVPSKRLTTSYPSFIYTAMAVLFLALITSIVNTSNPFEFLAGFKRYFQVWGLLFALAIIAYKPSSVRRWLWFVLIMAVVQFPVAVLQRFFLAPLRSGAGGGVVAVDVVSGTFDASLEGGGSSSIMALLVVIAIGYLAVAWREGVLKPGTAVLIGLPLVATLALGETKVTVLTLPLTLIVVFRHHLLRNFGTSVFLILLGILGAFFLGWMYLEFFAYSGQGLTVGQKLERVIAYNFGKEGYYGKYSLNRTTVLTFWWAEHGLHNPLQTFFGHGLGASYSGSGALVPGHLFYQYPFMAIGLTTASTLLWDLGLVGFGAYLLLHYQAWRVTVLRARQAKDHAMRSIYVTLEVAIVLFLVMIFYSNSMVSNFAMEVLWCMALGYLAWAGRQPSAEKSSQTSLRSA
jgi:hypothetical protein